MSTVLCDRRFNEFKSTKLQISSNGLIMIMMFMLFSALVVNGYDLKDNSKELKLLGGFHCGTITYKLVNSSGAVLATQINNSTFSGYPPGNDYKVVREDCCRKDSLTFNWEGRV